MVLQRILSLILAILTAELGLADANAAPQFEDLGGSVSILVTAKDRDNFSTNELRYEVRLRNESSDPLATESLIIVLDRIVNAAGEDRDPLKGDRLLSRIEVLEKDGQTADGKPFFSLPPSQGPSLPPHGISEPILVRFRAPEYTLAYPPQFRVLGERRLAPSASLEALIQLLIQKGVLSEEEWQTAIGGKSRSGSSR